MQPKKAILLLLTLLFFILINLYNYDVIDKKLFVIFEEKINYASNKYDGNKRILVTGAAGFIGMHVALALKKRAHFVYGLDNFNSYYLRTLKLRRSYELYKNNVSVLYMDVCNERALEKLFLLHNFTHVVHLAAQAGVRYSRLNPKAYATTNIVCFINLLETIRKVNKDINVVYASSSSVYGRNKKVPFKEKDEINLPSSMYAVSKKVGEDIASVYHYLYNIHFTGLRFFTVYGPWGRPDMAVYKFIENIIGNKPITVYSKGTLKRDFTYIDDIVSGVIAAINKGSKFDIFNLGKGHPESVNDLVSIIEKETCKKAIINYKSFRMEDVQQTFAEISHTYRQLGFKPSTNLTIGLKRTVDWYKNYTASRFDFYATDSKFLKSLQISQSQLAELLKQTSEEY